MLVIGITRKFKFEIFILLRGVIELQRSSTSCCDVIIDITDVFHQGFTLTRQLIARKIECVAGEEVRCSGKSFAGSTHQVSTIHHGISWSSLWGKQAATLRDCTISQSRKLFSCKIRTLSLTLCLFSVYKAIQEKICGIVDRRVLSQNVKFGAIILSHYWEITYLGGVFFSYTL